MPPLLITVPPTKHIFVGKLNIRPFPLSHSHSLFIDEPLISFTSLSSSLPSTVRIKVTSQHASNGHVCSSTMVTLNFQSSFFIYLLILFYTGRKLLCYRIISYCTVPRCVLFACFVEMLEHYALCRVSRVSALGVVKYKEPKQPNHHEHVLRQ